MKLLVRAPSTWQQERRYIWSVLLGDMLGLPHEVAEADVDHTIITLAGSTGSLSLQEGFFRLSMESWLARESLPRRPLIRLQIPSQLALPAHMPSEAIVLYGAEKTCETAMNFTNDGVQINFDLAGSAFFLLSRYEEAVLPDRDAHDRFPAEASLAVTEGFIERPLVNEYLELLWICLKHCWPGLQRKRRDYRVLLSHDVDSPLATPFSSGMAIAKSLAGDLLSRKDSGLAMQRVRSVLSARKGNYDADPNNTFDYIMDLSERHGLSSAFYFIAGGTTRYDADYTMDMPWIHGLVRRIAVRGHEVGLHPSYDTYLDPAKTAIEFDVLRECAERNGVHQSRWGGRQHYLRWRAGVTWNNWLGAGLDYDSSVGYAEIAGFRASCCYEYWAYDVTRRQATISERPLIVMETTLIAPVYLNLDREMRLSLSQRLARTCRIYNGDFTLLWHNSKLVSRHERSEYESMLSAVV